MNSASIAGDVVDALRSAGRLEETLATGAFSDLSIETVESVIAEASRFAAEVLAPLSRVGDRHGVAFDRGKVTTAPGFAEAYRQWTAAGWASIGAPIEWGGQGMPVGVQIAVQEIWNAANPAFALGTILTSGTVDALVAHADETLKARLLPQLVSGAWTGTMNLTEPQAGSDLGAIQMRAERTPGGTYRLFGQKIFITWGEHDLTDNIVHTVLARLPDAPPGTKGITMFAVPKILPEGTQNDIVAAGIEEKLGLHGAPTCTMIYGEHGQGAIAWRVGEENRGLAAMFTMMNMARLAVGVQGVGVAAGACEKAFDYARLRRQGHAPGAPPETASAIIEHPDVQRMLLSMRVLTAASRAICHATAHAIDMSRAAPVAERGGWADRAALLTPIAKAFSTDAAIDVANLSIQVHGGAGYIEETGAAQALRDARVFSIYEGTNGIQAIDLVTRKLPLDGGAPIAAVIADVRRIAERVAAVNRADFGKTAARLAAAAGHLERATEYLSAAQARDALAGAASYLRLAAVSLGGGLLAEAALSNMEDGTEGTKARFFAETFLGEAANLAETVVNGAAALSDAAHLMIARG